MKLRLCKYYDINAQYLFDESLKLGYKPYEDHDQFVCIDILNHDLYWRNFNNKEIKSDNNIIIFKFKD